MSESHVEDGAVAVEAARRVEHVVVALAVRLADVLEEVARAQFLLTVVAHEVLRMPDAPQRRDHLRIDNHVLSIL